MNEPLSEDAKRKRGEEGDELEEMSFLAKKSSDSKDQRPSEKKDDSSADDDKDEDSSGKEDEDKDENDSKKGGKKSSADKDDEEDDADEKDSDKDKKSAKKKGPPIYKKPAFIIIVSLVAIVLLVGGLIFWLIARQYVSTDDAYIDGHVTQVSPQIAARVLRLHVEDNQYVHRGDLLFELDPSDYEIALQQAEARTTTARARLVQAEAQKVSAATAVVDAEAQQRGANASLEQSARDLKRYQQLDDFAISRQQLDSAGTTKTNAQSRLEQANANAASARANVKTAEAGIETARGDVQTAEANEHQALTNLAYCKISAPIDGRVTQRTIEVGNYVTTAQPLCLLVDPNVWVTANFKETQLRRMRPGQHVTVKVDAFPDAKFEGQVESIQAGSGARFSVLPAENATGNYVKIVQRVPVKIVFNHDENTNNASMLSPGLSVIPRVKVR